MVVTRVVDDLHCRACLLTRDSNANRDYFRAVSTSLEVALVPAAMRAIEWFAPSCGGVSKLTVQAPHIVECIKVSLVMILGTELQV